MENIALVPMDRGCCHEFYRGFENDPAIFMDPSRSYTFVYDPAWVDAYFDRQAARGRVLLAVLLEGQPIGEVKLWDIDRVAGRCNLGIHLQSDAVKGRGIGTAAERLAAEYAFRELGVQTLWADAVVTNTRSQHVLQKAGFRFSHREGDFLWYRLDRRTFEWV